MEVSNERKIEKVVLKEEDILRITDFFQSEYKKMCEDKYKDLKISFKIDSEKKYLFKNEETINSSFIKNNKVIQIEYNLFSESKRISLFLTHDGNRGYENEFDIKGSDPDWVDLTYSRFNEMLDSVEPQKEWFKKIKIFLYIIACFEIAVLAVLISTLTRNNISSDESVLKIFLGNDKNIGIPIEWIIIFAISLSFCAILTLLFEKIEALWPSVEFDFGPNHLRFEKNRRKKIGVFITVIFIPIFIAFLFSFFSFS